jgi:hypothetical protein
MRHCGAHQSREQIMSSVRILTPVPAVRYRDAGHGRRTEIDHELLIAGGLFAALVVIGTAFFFAVAPAIADLASLYVSTT